MGMNMVNLLKTEFYKCFHNRGFWGMEVFSVLLSSLLLLDSERMTANLFLGSLYNTPLLYFLTILSGALLIGNDFGEKTLYCYISSGHKRSHVVLAKALIYQAACMAILGVPLLIHGLAGALGLKKAAIMPEDVLITGVVVFVSIAAMCMMPFFFAFLFRDMGRTLTVPMVIFFLMIFVLNQDQTQHLSTILPMGQLRLISKQQLTVGAVSIITMDAVWIVSLYFGAHFLFCRSDLN